MPSSRPPRRRRRSPTTKKTSAGKPRLTSLPTSRAAYVATREWLIDRHGSVCAYCGKQVAAETITLDHVTPRRGQTAYDRRDNLVLACRPCNAVKADTAALAFLLADRSRATNLVRFGDHLSPMLLDLARQLAGPNAMTAAEAAELEREIFGVNFTADDSPYFDPADSPYLD
jgi:5-methylcytosine-specific restriction endonuclease McrA